MEAQAVVTVYREDLWRLHEEMKGLHGVQAEHADRLLRLERRQDDDARMKSVWGPSSPFPGVLSGTPQQGPIHTPVADEFDDLDEQQSQNLLGSLHLDQDDEPRRGAASRANSVRFDESANQGHWTQGPRSTGGDVFQMRSGSSLGGHPMTERSFSYRSDGRQSSGGHSNHSGQSGPSARNSLRLDASYDFGQASRSPFDALGPPPGLSILGSVPSIIRCWLDTNFSHDTLKYAVICTGSYRSLLDARQVKQLGLEDQVTKNQLGEDVIKLPLYLPEAMVQQTSSRAGTPEPQLPSVTVEFRILDQEPAFTNSTAIQIFLGMDVLKAHMADILLSQNSMTLYDDDRNRLSVPFVRPEDEAVFKTLLTTNLTLSAANTPQNPANLGTRSQLEQDTKPNLGYLPPRSRSVSPADGDGPDDSADPAADSDFSWPTRSGANQPSASSSTAGSNVWGTSWRRDAGQSPTGDGFGTSGRYQRPGRGRGMKILRPSRSSTTAAAAPSPTTGGMPDAGAGSARALSGDWKIAQPSPRGAGGELQDITNRPPRGASNPVGGASAFAWLNPAGGAPARSTAATGE